MLSRLLLAGLLIAGSGALIAAPPAGCAATTCIVGAICVEDEFGQASCIENPCNVKECPLFKNKCVVKDGKAVCVEEQPAGCAATTCTVGSICVEDEFGQASCIENPCNVKECPLFKNKCVVKDGKAVCIEEQPAGCAATTCTVGSICVEDEFGQASCIENPCNVKECPFFKNKCVVKDGKAVCVEERPAGCAVVQCPKGIDCIEDDAGVGHCSEEEELDVRGYYLLKQDQRRCIDPLCGGYWITKVNRRKMRCADGIRKQSCYIAEFTSDLKPHFTSNENILIKGTRSKKDFGKPFGILGTFSLDRGHVAVTDVDGFGSFFAIENNGVQCITKPCLVFDNYLLNTRRIKRTSSIEFDGKLGDEAAEKARTQLSAGEVVLVSATRRRVKSKSGKEKQLLVNQIYNPTVECPKGYLWHKDACRTKFGCAHPQLEMILVGGVPPNSELGEPTLPTTTTICVDSCEDHQHTGPGTCTAHLQ